MYYELIINDNSKKELLKLAQERAAQLYQTVKEEFDKLSDELNDGGMEEEFEALDKLQENCDFFLKLNNLLGSFDNQKSIKIPQHQFHFLRTDYLFYGPEIDNLFVLFQKKSNTNTVSKHSYLKQAILNAFDYSKENLPPIIHNIKTNEDLNPDTEKQSFKL